MVFFRFSFPLTNNQKLQFFSTGDVKKKWKSSLRQQQIIFENNSNHYNLETAFPDEFTDHYMFEVRRIREILWKVNSHTQKKRLLVLEINFPSIFFPGYCQPILVW